MALSQADNAAAAEPARMSDNVMPRPRVAFLGVRWLDWSSQMGVNRYAAGTVRPGHTPSPLRGCFHMAGLPKMKTEPPKTDLLIGIANIAAELGVTPRTARHMIASDQIPTFVFASRRCARRSTLQAFLAEREAAGASRFMSTILSAG